MTPLTALPTPVAGGLPVPSAPLEDRASLVAGRLELRRRRIRRWTWVTACFMVARRPRSGGDAHRPGA
jgi:hypothetical protein